MHMAVGRGLLATQYLQRLPLLASVYATRELQSLERSGPKLYLYSPCRVYLLCIHKAMIDAIWRDKLSAICVMSIPS